MNEPLTLYVKYDSKYPYLPIAVADTKKELAQMLGVDESVVYSSFSHHRSTYKEVKYRPECYADNDGGAWFWHPVTGEAVYMRD